MIDNNDNVILEDKIRMIIRHNHIKDFNQFIAYKHFEDGIEVDIDNYNQMITIMDMKEFEYLKIYYYSFTDVKNLFRILKLEKLNE